jgi:hypothetical protein
MSTTTTHELLVGLFRDDPRLLIEPLRACGLELPAHDRTKAVDASLGELLPTERRADLLLLYEAEAPVFAVVLEVQLRVDAEKEWRWASYLAAVQDRHRCPCALVVVTPDAAVARWPQGPFQFGTERLFRPVVVDASRVPRLDELPRAQVDASRALLSVGMHVRDEADLRLVDLAMARTMPGVDVYGGVRQYWQYILAAVDRRLQAAVEEKMKVDLSEARPFIDRIERMLMEHGRAEGRQEGRQEGRREGQLEAARAMFRQLASARGLPLGRVHEARLGACDDVERITLWSMRLLRAASADEAMD